MKAITLFASLGFAALSAFAQTASAARTGVNLAVTDITIIGGGNKARIYIESGVTGTTPGCGSSRPNHFAIDLGTDKGRAMINLATAAMLSGKSINVTGLNSCLNVGGTSYQTLDQITLNP